MSNTNTQNNTCFPPALREGQTCSWKHANFRHHISKYNSGGNVVTPLSFTYCFAQTYFRVEVKKKDTHLRCLREPSSTIDNEEPERRTSWPLVRTALTSWSLKCVFEWGMLLLLENRRMRTWPNEWWLQKNVAFSEWPLPTCKSREQEEEKRTRPMNLSEAISEGQFDIFEYWVRMHAVDTQHHKFMKWLREVPWQ